MLFRFRLVNAVKPHTDKVTMVSMVSEKNLIVTGSTDKTLFFFKFVTTDKGIDMDPIRCIQLDYVAINFEWISTQVWENGIIQKHFEERGEGVQKIFEEGRGGKKFSRGGSNFSNKKVSNGQNCKYLQLDYG